MIEGSTYAVIAVVGLELKDDGRMSVHSAATMYYTQPPVLVIMQNQVICSPCPFTLRIRV